MDKHSIYSPSRLHRIIECPGSVQLIKANSIVGKTSVHAEHGTMLHKYTEDMLVGMIPDIKALKYNLMREELYNSGDEYLVMDAVNYFADVMRSKNTHKVLASYESQVSLASFGIPEVYGTLDASIIDLTAMHVDIFDWKFGRGVQVFAKENPQQMAYGAGSVQWPPKHPIYSVTLHIVQPTFDHYDAWETNIDELYKWVHGDLATAILQSKQDPPVFNPGEEQCRFCEAAKSGKCDYRHAKATQNAIEIFQNAKLKANLTPKQIQAYLNMFPLVERVAKGYMIYVQEELERGSKEFDQFKLVHGRANRKWINEDDVVKWVSEHTEIDDLFDSKLKSPSKLEAIDKSLKKNVQFQKLYGKPEGSLKLASVSDYRTAVDINKSAEEIFKDVQFPDLLE